VSAGGVIRRRLIVSGRVQGVFFRDTLRRQAESRAVAGWAANRDDGDVEAVLEGDSAAIDELVAFCRRGPSRAEVANVQVFEEDPEGLRGFRIA
jgi:acylphosphatase